MRFKNLERYRTGGTRNKMQLSVPPPKTPDGRIYRFSPNEKAHPRHFVLGDADPTFVISEASRARMKLKPRSTQTVCPYSGIVADDSDFAHPDDVKAVVKMVEQAAFSDIEAELSRMIDGFNRSLSRNSFIQIQASLKSTPQPKPRFSRRDLLRELVCDHCGRDYGVYAIGLFCPDCGAPNLRLHFARETDLVRTQVKLAETQADERQELAYRLLGNAHEDVLTAFEATLKTVYLYGVAQRGPDAPTIKPLKNDFQNVDVAQNRFAEFDLDPFDCLEAGELATLKLNIQKRHIIGHNLGVVDAKFAEHADDARVGETIHLVGEDICLFADLSQRAVDRLDTWLSNAPAPTTIQPLGTSGTSDDRGKSTSSEEAMALSVDDMDLNLGPLARHLGRWLAEQSEVGMTWPISDDAILADFTNVSPADLAEAAAELEIEGFVTTSLRGSQLPHIRPTLDLYATFDPIAVGSNPVADALALTKMVLAGEASVNVADLHAKTGWTLRRFNPAIGLVIAQVDDRRVSKTIDNTYPARSFHLLPEDRVALKRFAAQLEA